MFALLRGLLLGLLATLAIPCKGAEISCLSYADKGSTEKALCEAGLIRGEIVEGDYDKFITFYSQSHPHLGTMHLQSPGGDVIEAIKIGRLFRKYFITAWAPFHVSLYSGESDFSLSSAETSCKGEGCVCASSCALIWFGAPKRIGAVGLHRPVIASSRFKDLPPGEAEQAYKPALALMTQYLEEMEVPKALIEAMVATSSSNIHWVTGMEYFRSPSFAEWEDANCGSQDVANNEYYESFNLKMKKQNAELTHQEKLLLSLLNERAKKNFDCLAELERKNRSKIPPPSVVAAQGGTIDKSQSRLVAPTGHLTFAKPENEPAPRARLRFAPVQQGAPQ